ncbi:MAG: hypothetical protein GYB58_21315, partial [Gammaproteobacteria bacterium]|nr:hypothetical protein [Gammaproteobacteria bacterium]
IKKKQLNSSGDNYLEKRRKLQLPTIFYEIQELKIVCIEKIRQAEEKPKNLQKFYNSFKHEDEKFPKNPFIFYNKVGQWESWRELFGLAKDQWLTYQELKDICTNNFIIGNKTSKNLTVLYLKIRDKSTSRKKMPRHPDEFYKNTGEWISYKSLFGLE